MREGKCPAPNQKACVSKLIPILSPWFIFFRTLITDSCLSFMCLFARLSLSTQQAPRGQGLCPSHSHSGVFPPGR